MKQTIAACFESYLFEEELKSAHFETLSNILDKFDESIFTKISTKTALLKLIDYDLLEKLENLFPKTMHICMILYNFGNIVWVLRYKLIRFKYYRT